MTHHLHRFEKACIEAGKQDRLGGPVPQIHPNSKWYLAVTNPNCERRAVLELYALGFRTFMPKIRKWASHARVRKAVERPLLGRYVFVEIDHPNQSFHAVRSANGIECLLSNPEPLVVPSHWVDSLRDRYMRGEWDQVAQEDLPLGARIRIVEGQFDNLLATITKRKGASVTVKLLGENRYEKMNVCSVRAA